ncbi:hypothetical protein E2C01_026788 [Portunus trituberculatus]|uniref:Uncharacterized protein n=1 Tax=Portunus trituberculatus TaxID=210409 RepID=A0A5B7EJA8_PORTR|nr:hypothetical protein [Portunus trituberculatus]
MERLLYFLRSIDGNGGLRVPGVHDLGEIAALVGDVGDRLQATVWKQHEVTAVRVLAMAGFRMPMQAAVQGISCHVLEGIVWHCLWGKTELVYTIRDQMRDQPNLPQGRGQDVKKLRHIGKGRRGGGRWSQTDEADRSSKSP